jgi:choice-of-anchor B domain-containing protein
VAALLGLLADAAWAPLPCRAQDARLNVDLVGRFHPYGGYSDVWGYVAPDGTELAILGSVRGVSFVDATDPGNPVELGFFPGQPSSIRDIKTYRDHAFVIAGSSDGLGIFSLEDPSAPRLVRTDFRFFATAHNIYIDTRAAHLYVCLPNGQRGFDVLDISDPPNPELIVKYRDVYPHDIYVRDGLAYVAEMHRGSLTILDVSELPEIRPLGEEFTSGLFTHNTWLDDHGGLCLTTDENIGGYVNVFDVRDATRPRFVATWTNPTDSLSTVHNVTIRGNLAFASWYKAGVRIADIGDERFPQLVGVCDMFAGTGLGYNGAFGIYPLQPSGTLYVSDMRTGLWLLRFDPDYGSVSGQVRDAWTGELLQDVSIRGDLPANEVRSLATGGFRLALGTGVRTLVFERYGYQSLELDVSIVRGDELNRDVMLKPAPGGVIHGTVVDASRGVPVAGVPVGLAGTPWSTESDRLGAYRFRPVPVGTYALHLNALGWHPDSALVEVTAGSTLEHNFLGQPALFADDAENDRGWEVGTTFDDATAGRWERAAPEPTGQGLFPIQPPADHTPNQGQLAFVTGARGGTDGENDVDGGSTTLLSPLLDLSGVAHPVLRYHRWFANLGLAGQLDGSLHVDVSNDDGGTWVNLETLTDNRNRWERVELDLAKFIEPTDRVQVRFVASDTGDGRTVVEALVDDIQIDATGERDSTPATASTRALVFDVRPNPFRGETQVWLNLVSERFVNIDVVDVRGRRVATLLNQTMTPGLHAVRWGGASDAGSPAGSGVYFVRVSDGTATQVQRIVRLR